MVLTISLKGLYFVVSADAKEVELSLITATIGKFRKGFECFVGDLLIDWSYETDIQRELAY
jgi:hypothetical protein